MGDDADAPVLVDSRGREFALLRLLGEGGFGEVYLARTESDGGLAQQVALKILKADLDPRSQAVERLQDEAKVLSELDHPNILAARDLSYFGNRIALITEYIEGLDLYHILRPSVPTVPPLPRGTLLEVIEAVADALHAAWEKKGIVHRDIKLSNIRIGKHGSVKLLDFGIAKSIEGNREAKTGTQQIIGTLGYLAPERLRLEPLTPASDIFSLGCVLYEDGQNKHFLKSYPNSRSWRSHILQISRNSHRPLFAAGHVASHPVLASRDARLGQPQTPQRPWGGPGL